MKKLLALVLSMMLALFALPLLTVSPMAAPADGPGGPGDAPLPAAPSAPVALTDAAAGSWDDRQTVTVRIDGETRTFDLRSYLIGVMAAEMPASFPEEALKAQAVAARTYTLYKQALYAGGGAPESHGGAQLCADPGHCKAWCDLSVQAAALWGDSTGLYLEKLTAAVDGTDGLVLTHEGAPIAAVFHSASAGRTENAADVWGTEIPYLVSVESPGGEDAPRYQGEVRVRQSDFAAAMTALAPEADFSAGAESWFRDSHRSQAGGVIDLLVGGARVRGGLVRQAAGLNSTNFRVRTERDDLVFTTTGSGHGVGLSQYGARAMARDGADYTEILLHYYTGAQLLKKSD